MAGNRYAPFLLGMFVLAVAAPSSFQLPALPCDQSYGIPNLRHPIAPAVNLFGVCSAYSTVRCSDWMKWTPGTLVWLSRSSLVTNRSQFATEAQAS